MFEAIVGDLDAVEIEFLEFSQVAKVLQAVISNQRSNQCQVAQILHAGERSQGGVTNIGDIQIERLQIHQRLQTLWVFDRGEGHAQVLELSQRSHALDPFIADVQPRERRQTRLKPLQL